MIDSLSQENDEPEPTLVPVVLGHIRRMPTARFTYVHLIPRL
jgi:hypothetical protein